MDQRQPSLESPSPRLLAGLVWLSSLVIGLTLWRVFVLWAAQAG
jgi:hypothetical protein